jgi:hypothetical protein
MSLMELGVWSKRVRVELGGGYEEVVVQTIGDRTEALEYGHEAMQRKLLEFRAEGERFAALTEALRLSPTEDLAAFVVEGEQAALLDKLLREMPNGVAPRRDTAAGETEAALAARRRAWEAAREQLVKKREEELQVRSECRRRELCTMPKDELIELARARRIDVECWNAFHQASDDWVLYEATRKAEAPLQLYFASVEEVRRLHPEVKGQLTAGYRELEEQEAELPKGC